MFNNFIIIFIYVAIFTQISNTDLFEFELRSIIFTIFFSKSTKNHGENYQLSQGGEA